MVFPIQIHHNYVTTHHDRNFLTRCWWLMLLHGCIILTIQNVASETNYRLWNNKNTNYNQISQNSIFSNDDADQQKQNQYIASNPIVAEQTFSHLDRPIITTSSLSTNNIIKHKQNNAGLYDNNNDRWLDREFNRDDNNDSNEIEHNSFEKPGSRDYVCGRAVAMEKQRSNNYYRDQFHQQQGSGNYARNKYRPLEIRMPRIIGGDETEAGEFPWIASIKLNGQPICGGSLIDRSWVLTAAHCVVGYNPKNLTVRLGSYRIKDMTEVQSIELPVNMFIVHKDYSVPRPFSNDIALLKLSNNVRFTDYIIPVCLPYEDQLFGHATQMGSISGGVATTLEDFRSQIMNHNNIGNYDAMDLSESGIVVSTKMSDLDIALCFNKLEQNYLSSIGISPTPMANGSNGGSDAAGASTNAGNAENYQSDEQVPVAGSASAISSSQFVARPQQTSTSPSPQTSEANDNIFSYHDVFNSILIPIKGENIKDTITLFSPHPSSGSSSFNNYQTDQDFLGDSTDKLKQTAYYSWPSASSAAASSSSNVVFDAQLGRASVNRGPKALPIELSHDHSTGSDELAMSKRDIIDPASEQARFGSTAAHKLSRLPINNELIKEIHAAASSNSIGPFGNINHGDIAAMASDLINSQQGQTSHHNNQNCASSSSAGHNHLATGSHNGFPSAPSSSSSIDQLTSSLLDVVDQHSSPSYISPSASSSSSSSSVSNYREKITTNNNNNHHQLSKQPQENDHGLTSSGTHNNVNENNNLVHNNRLKQITNSNSNNMVDLDGNNNMMNEDLNGIANNQLTGGNTFDDPTRYAGLNGIVVGWGWIKELEADDANSTKGTPSVTLQKVRLPVLRNKVCESWFQSQSKKITLLPSQFCAGFQGGGKDACRGDSGGPMIIEDSTDTGRYKLIGIVSAGIGCARPSLPGLYTRVASFLPWINAQINRY